MTHLLQLWTNQKPRFSFVKTTKVTPHSPNIHHFQHSSGWPRITNYICRYPPFLAAHLPWGAITAAILIKAVDVTNSTLPPSRNHYTSPAYTKYRLLSFNHDFSLQIRPKAVNTSSYPQKSHVKPCESMTGISLRRVGTILINNFGQTPFLRRDNIVL